MMKKLGLHGNLQNIKITTAKINYSNQEKKQPHKRGLSKDKTNETKTNNKKTIQ